MRSYLPGIYCLGVCFYTLLDHMDMFLLEPSVLSHTNSWWFPVGLLLQHRLTSALCLHERGHGSHVYIPSFSFPFLRSCCFFYTSGTLYSVRTGNDCGREVCKLVDISLLQPGSVWAGKTLPLKGEQHKLEQHELEQVHKAAGEISILGDFWHLPELGLEQPSLDFEVSLQRDRGRSLDDIQAKAFHEMIMFDHVKLGAKHSYLCTFMCPGKQANCPSYNWESKHSCWQIVMRGWGRRYI